MERPQRAPSNNSDSQQKDEYEIVPANQLEYLRHEVEKLKRNPLGETEEGKDLLSEVAQLNQHMKQLVAIFQTANDDIVKDYKDQANTEKVNRLLDQNERLAKGMVTIAELLKEVKTWRRNETQESIPLSTQSTNLYQETPRTNYSQNRSVASPDFSLPEESYGDTQPAAESPFPEMNRNAPPQRRTFNTQQVMGARQPPRNYPAGEEMLEERRPRGEDAAEESSGENPFLNRKPQREGIRFSDVPPPPPR